METPAAVAPYSDWTVDQHRWRLDSGYKSIVATVLISNSEERTGSRIAAPVSQVRLFVRSVGRAL